MAESYVDLNASTNGSGTVGSPYNSFAPFVSSITAGDRIRVKRGTTKVLNAGTRINVTINGSGETLIDTYGEGANPILSGGGTNFNPIYVKRVSGGGNLIIRDLDVTNTPNDGIVIESAASQTISNVLVQRCRAYGTNVLNGAGKDGIRISCAKDGGLISNVVIDNCDAFNNQGHGIKVRDNTQNILVSNCRAWNNGIGSPSHGMGTSHSRALVASAGAWVSTSGGAYQATISTTALFQTTITLWLAVFCNNQNGYFWLTPTASSPPSPGQFYTGGSNTLEINVGAAPSAAGVYAAYLPTTARFEFCEVWGTIDTDGNEGHGFGTDDLTQSAVYVGCVSRNNEGAGWTGNISQAAALYGSISHDNEKHGFYATGGKNVVLYNNDMIGNTLQGFRVQSGGTGAYFRNNIFAENGGYGISSSSASYTIDEDYNCVYGNVGGAKENVSSSGANGILLDPLLDASYRPTANSPCIGNGTYLPSARHYGGKRMSPVSPVIGAHGYYAARPVATDRDVRLVGA